MEPGKPAFVARRGQTVVIARAQSPIAAVMFRLVQQTGRRKQLPRRSRLLFELLVKHQVPQKNVRTIADWNIRKPAGD
jgi:hypothetical protein